MSFRQNGRYGYVPPAQYGSQSSAPGSSLRRQSSFDHGDDAEYLEGTGEEQRAGVGAANHLTQTSPSRDELYFNGPPPPPPPRPSHGASAGYQRYDSATLPTSAASAYDPSRFAGVAPTQSSGVYASRSLMNQQYGAQRPTHAPYVPAAYQQPSQRQQTMHAHSQGVEYAQVSTPASPYQHQPPYGYAAPQRAYSVQQSYTNSSPAQASPISPSRHAPLPSTPSPHRNPLPPVPYPLNGSQSTHQANTGGPQYRMPDAPYSSSFNASPSVERTRSSPSGSTYSAPSPDPISSLRRHPTGRGLPSTPQVISDSGEDIPEEWEGQDRSAEEQAQEQIYQEIEAAMLNNASHGANSGDLLDGELGDMETYGQGSSTMNPTDYGRTSTTAYEYDFDDDSDLEAASGLEAMRLAEQEDMRMGSGTFGMSSFQSSAPPTPPPKNKRPPTRDLQDSSDSDYANVDMGLYGGGYDAHMSYGDGVAHLGHSSEMDDQSRPLPTPHELNRNSSGRDSASGLGGMYDHNPGYRMPEGDSHHPFPAFDAARVDEAGTGGLQRPSSQRNRLSFDEGDESIRFTESQNSGYSGGESPGDDIPEMFYHPGMSPSLAQRPLPAVPQTSSYETPHMQAPGQYRTAYQHQYSSSTDDASSHRNSYLDGPDAYGASQGFLSPNAPYVPRSTSLISHSSTPQVVPPVRSRTDAEERQAKQRALRGPGAYDSLDASGQPSTAPVDLPSIPHGRRRKVSPENLRSQDFMRCTEPWAISAIALWLREMFGGDTGDGESDLREKLIIECMIALFTHKVPTMNIADAEVLSDRLLKDMFTSKSLVRDEEWVKFGPGTISGVLWQLTGSGCYSPVVHNQEIRGRCYSHHCGRTLKKLNLSLGELEPAKKTEDWPTFFKITKEVYEAADKKEVHRQNALHEIVMSEDKYMDNLNVLRVLYRDQLQSWQPLIIAPEKKLSKFIVQVFGKVETVKLTNQENLLAQLKYRQKEQGPWVQGFSDIFREWIRKSKQVYLDYAAGYAHANYLMRREAEKNVLFKQFLDQAQNNAMSNRLDWVTYLYGPLKRLQQYPLMLREVLKCSIAENEEKTNLVLAIDEITAVVSDCDKQVAEMQKKVEMTDLSAKLFLRPGMERVELNLDHLGRELIFQGDLQRAGSNRFTWLETHAILFDHYLVLAKSVPRSEPGGVKKVVYDVSKLPIPMQLLVLESTSDEVAYKSKAGGLAVATRVAGTGQTADVRGRGSTSSDRPSALQHTNTDSSMSSATTVTGSANALSKTVTSTNLDDNARLMYPFRVKHLGKSEVYTLYAPTAQNRAQWCDKITEAKERHATSLFAQNAEPFKLKVMADSAFAYDAASAKAGGILIRGTPLDRAIRDMETEYGPTRPGPICRAAVNCATTFSAYGKTMVAIGTDYGVYTCEAANPRGWAKAIQVTRVTQITIVEDFSLCLIIADKALIAYHLDVILPSQGSYAQPFDSTSSRRAPQKLSGTRDVGFFATGRMKDRTLIFYKKREGLSSTFKVLEPIYQKSSEKKSKLHRKLLGGGSNAEFFREFDEFYIPSDCYSIDLFHTYIAVSTPRGFELLTLDRKQPMSIPDLKQPAIATIASRLNGQKPLGMFRLSEAEFLLCYEECGVYIDKHGEVSRSVILEFVGKASSATLFGAYLVLFDNDFVEVRNVENGRLRQVIAGKDVRCLDYGSSGGVERERNIKITMAHPEISGSQLVLELSLNNGITG